MTRRLKFARKLNASSPRILELRNCFIKKLSVSIFWCFESSVTLLHSSVLVGPIRKSPSSLLLLILLVLVFAMNSAVSQIFGVAEHDDVPIVQLHVDPVPTDHIHALDGAARRQSVSKHLDEQIRHLRIN